MSVEALFDALLAFLEHGAAELLPGLTERRVSPRPGTVLISRRTLRVSGRDMRSDGAAEGFILRLPARSVVRVEPFGESVDELWVRPMDAAVVEQLSAPQRRCATLYGYLLEIPPGNWRSSFDVVKPTT